MVKKLTGSSEVVFQSLTLLSADNEEFGKNRGIAENTSLIRKDIRRTAFVGFAKQFSDFKSACMQESVYAKPYAQGNLDAGGLMDRLMLYQINEKQPLNFNFLGGLAHIRFAYYDDAETLCGFCLAFNVENPAIWAIQIDSNTTGALEERRTTLLDNGMLLASVDTAVSIDFSKFPEELVTTLNSQPISHILTRLIEDSGNVCQQKFKDLKTRIGPGRNIDHRDLKRQKLAELMLDTHSLIGHELDQVKNVLDQYDIRSVNEIDFFKSPGFERYVSTIFQYTRNELSKLGDFDQDYSQKILNNELIYCAIKLELRALIMSRIGDDRHNHACEVLRRHATAFRILTQPPIVNTAAWFRNDDFAILFEEARINALGRFKEPVYQDLLTKWAIICQNIEERHVQYNNEKSALVPPIVPNQDKNFLQRNWGFLGLGAALFSGFVGLTFMLNLLPFFIVLSCTIMAWTSIAVKIKWDEAQYWEVVQSLPARELAYQAHLLQLDNRYKDDVNRLINPFKERVLGPLAYEDGIEFREQKEEHDSDEDSVSSLGSASDDSLHSGSSLGSNSGPGSGSDYPAFGFPSSSDSSPGYSPLFSSPPPPKSPKRLRSLEEENKEESSEAAAAVM